MEKIYLKHGAEDIQGNKLNTRTEYTIVAETMEDVTISNGYKHFRVKHKYIKWPGRK